jgi:hypothetical protein
MNLNAIDTSVFDDMAEMTFTVMSGMIFLAIPVIALFSSI